MSDRRKGIFAMGALMVAFSAFKEATGPATFIFDMVLLVGGILGMLFARFWPEEKS